MHSSNNSRTFELTKNKGLLPLLKRYFSVVAGYNSTTSLQINEGGRCAELALTFIYPGQPQT